MKKLLISFIIAFTLQFTAVEQGKSQSTNNGRQQLAEKIDTTNLDLKKFAGQITAGASSNFEKARVLLDWLSNRLEWKATDYQKRTVNEILARQGGNCFELAKVYMAMINELNIPYRPVAEINFHRYSENRQHTAEEKVKQSGNSMSVFGLQHNDHRWVEIYNDQSKEWEPVDPSTNLIGTVQWLKARAGFGERVTIDTNFTNDMIVPFAIFVVSTDKKSTMTENRTLHYLVEDFDKLYNNRLSTLPSWKTWVEKLNEINEPCRNAFEGKTNLHQYSKRIDEIGKTYLQLKQEYLTKYKN